MKRTDGINKTTFEFAINRKNVMSLELLIGKPMICVFFTGFIPVEKGARFFSFAPFLIALFISFSNASPGLCPPE